MNRRAFLGACSGGLLGAPSTAYGQPKGRLPRIGVINFNYPPQRAPGVSIFWGPMEKLGWVEGVTVLVERRDARGDWNRISILATELGRLDVDVFLVGSEGIAQRIQSVARLIPICVYAGDLQAAGLVKNLAKPDQNVTGVQNVQVDLAGKGVALLNEVVPTLMRVGVLVEGRTHPTNAAIVRAVEETARSLRLQVQVADLLPHSLLEYEFSALGRARVGALLVASGPRTGAQRSQIIALAARNRMVALYAQRSAVEAGGLMSYGVVEAEVWLGLARCVDKILRGAKPAEVPVQQPTQFELAINLKTAKALGLSIPPALLQRADHIIE